MNMFFNLLTLLLSISSSLNIEIQSNNQNSSNNHYFGQKPPETVPELFGKDIIPLSKDLHSCPVFSKDGKMAFWKLMNCGKENGVYFTQLTDKSWETPKKFSIIETDTEYNNDVPYFSQNDGRLYFLSNRPFHNQERKKRIWYTMKENGSWIKPKLFEKINPNTFMLHWQFSISDKGVFYFTGIREDGVGAYDIFRAVPFNTEYRIEKLDSPINTEYSDICPFIAPDESYLIFSSSNRDDGYGEIDLYICFKLLNGDWSNPINMGPEMNSDSHDWCPMVSYDGKYLFFTSFRNGNCNAYWVKSNIINKLRNTIK